MIVTAWVCEDCDHYEGRLMYAENARQHTEAGHTVVRVA